MQKFFKTEIPILIINILSFVVLNYKRSQVQISVGDRYGTIHILVWEKNNKKNYHNDRIQVYTSTYIRFNVSAFLFSVPFFTSLRGSCIFKWEILAWCKIEKCQISRIISKWILSKRVRALENSWNFINFAICGFLSFSISFSLSL